MNVYNVKIGNETSCLQINKPVENQLDYVVGCAHY